MQLDVYHYFQQACRRKLKPVSSRMRIVSDGEVEAGFEFQQDGPGVIRDVEYRCTTCMTLVALCEHVAERIRGTTAAEAGRLTVTDILQLHPEIPRARHGRARLAIAAALENLKS